VEQLENCLHPIVEELKRWQSIIGEHYINHKLEEQRNSLAYKPLRVHHCTILVTRNARRARIVAGLHRFSVPVVRSVLAQVQVYRQC
jgi:hypothetical protein